jgi:hypothetical protein
MIFNILAVFNEIQTSTSTATRRLKPKSKGKVPPAHALLKKVGNTHRGVKFYIQFFF